MTKKKNPKDLLKVGRPSKYKSLYCQKIIDYFDIDCNNFRDSTITYKNGDTKDVSEEEANSLPTFMKFARSIGVWHDTLHNWCERYPEFLLAYNRAKELQTEFVIENALRNNYSGYFAGLMMKNMFGWREKTEVEHSGEIKFTQEERLAINNRIRSLVKTD